MFSLIETRNRHLLRAAQRYIDSLPETFYLDLATVAAKVAMSPAPCYYCNYIYALRMLYVYRNSNIKLKEGRRTALWAELSRKVDEFIARHPCSVSEALAMVLSRGQASQFFISPVTANSILRRYFNPKTRKLMIP